jgi:hypothetical protein
MVGGRHDEQWHELDGKDCNVRWWLLIVEVTRGAAL